jgi:signal transduction histidine kinase
MEFDLSPPVLRQLGLAPALDWLADEMYQQYGLRVGVSDDGEPKPLLELSQSIAFRLIRELLINVVRHAGVKRAHVDTQRAGDIVIVTVSDEGAGFDSSVAESGLGLVSVRERIGYIGGNAVIASNPGEGTVVTLSIPLMTRAVLDTIG